MSKKKQISGFEAYFGEHTTKYICSNLHAYSFDFIRSLPLDHVIKRRNFLKHLLLGVVEEDAGKKVTFRLIFFFIDRAHSCISLIITHLMLRL